MVYIEHDYRDPQGHRFQTLYAHLHRVLVEKGQRVAAGTAVGTLGGSSQGELKHFNPHLHFAMYRDAKPRLGGGEAWRPEPMGGTRNLRTGLRMIACGPPSSGTPVAIGDQQLGSGWIGRRMPTTP
jgi:murein DD-endopeptidase MepM/ murein hydrolase activator NlpD